MDRLRFIILLLPVILFCSGVKAQTYSINPSRDSLTVAVLNQLHVPSTGDNELTTAIVHKQINKSVAQVCTDFPAVEKLDTVIIGRWQEGGSLNTDFDRAYSVMKIVGDTLRVPINRLPDDSLFDRLGGETGLEYDYDKLSHPRYFNPFDYYLFVYPKVAIDSAGVDTFLVKYYAMDDALTSATDSTVINPRFINPLISHVCYMLSLYREDDNAAAIYKKDYEAYLR